MAEKDLLVDLSQVDFKHVIADLHEIRRYNAQRHEMEQLTAIVYQDLKHHVCVGYKDVSADEFWCRGHMPGMPIMPGVMMLEAVAQLCSYFATKYDLLGAEMLGFGALDEVRFRDPVIPGDRLVLMCQMEKVRRGKIIVCRFQGAVRRNVVLSGVLKGISLPVDALKQELARQKVAQDNARE